MGTEVATRPPLPPGLAPGSNSQGPGRKKRERGRERERSFSTSSHSTVTNSTSGSPIYGRDVQLRIQGKKYSLSSAFVCIGAKIHKRYSPSSSISQDEKFKLPLPLPDDRFRYTVSPAESRFKYSHSPQEDRAKYFVDRDTYAQYHQYHYHPDTEFLYQEDRRGLSRVNLEEHPTSMLDIVEQQSLPPEFTNKTTEAITSYRDPPSDSNRSSPNIITEETPSSIPFWEPGNTTERSSVDSQYSLYEFDRQAAKTLNNLLDEIDSVLFERRPNQAEYIYNECQEWVSQFLHLRILGRQLLPVQESGYEMIERDLLRPNTTSSMGLMDVTEQDLSGSQDSQGQENLTKLSVSGRGVQAIIPPIEARSRNSGTPSTQSSEFSHLEEEVFEQEGEYEEIIAVDYKDIYEDQSDSKKQLTPRRRRIGYPPVTPNACLKDTVASSAFDCIWQEIISWIRPLLRKYSIIVLDENKRIPPSHQAILQAQRHDLPGPPSRENSQIRFQNLGRSHTIMGVESRVESPKLDGLLQISRKIVVQREPSNLVDPSESQLSVQPARPASSFPNYTYNKRPTSTRNVQGQGRQRGTMMRLAPIAAPDRIKTPSVDEDRTGPHLLVRKINPPGVNRLSSPPYNTRNGVLPPIGTPVELEPSTRYQTQKKMVASRASSAVDKELRVAYRDRYLSSQEARPSTTHAFRSETPQNLSRRASTPLNSSAFNQSSSRNPYFPGGLNLDIRGSGLQPSQDIGHSMVGHNFQEILEAPEGLDEHIHPNQWTPSTPSHNNPYYKKSARQFSSLVRS